VLTAPSDAEGRNAFGQFLIRQQLYPQAVLQLKKATSLDPSRNDYWAALGRAQVFTRDWKNAVDSYRKAGPQYYNQMKEAEDYLQKVEQVNRYNQQLKQQQQDRE
jgi:cytochrome c-type biogenesis protein CcmH/NrfG